MIGSKVLGAGPVPCSLVLVGEGPGKTEAAEGRPFCGASGSELDWVFLKRAAKLRREDVYVTNIVKYRTDEDDSDPTDEDIKRDEEELLLEIEIVNPSIIVAIGRIAGAWFHQSSDIDMEKCTGVPVQCPRFPDKALIVTYHPAAGLHSPERYYHQIFYNFEQVGKLVRGEIGIMVDRFAPNYQLIDTLPTHLGMAALDTEGNLANPWGLSLSAGAGTGSVWK